MGSYANTSPSTSLNWQKLLYGFTGNGNTQKIKIVTEATAFDANGRGAMIDDIALTEVMPANTGLEDTAIRLSAISAALTDTDGSETLAITISAIPVGAKLSDGTRTFTATTGNTSVDITAWSKGNLTLLPPPDFYGVINLTVTAKSTETANNNQASTTANLAITVRPVNDAPVARNASVVVKKGQ